MTELREQPQDRQWLKLPRDFQLPRAYRLKLDKAFASATLDWATLAPDEVIDELTLPLGGVGWIVRMSAKIPLKSLYDYSIQCVREVGKSEAFSQARESSTANQIAIEWVHEAGELSCYSGWGERRALLRQWTLEGEVMVFHGSQLLDALVASIGEDTTQLAGFFAAGRSVYLLEAERTAQDNQLQKFSCRIHRVNHLPTLSQAPAGFAFLHESSAADRGDEHRRFSFTLATGNRRINEISLRLPVVGALALRPEIVR